MKSLVGYLLAGFVSAFASGSAWAGGSDGSGNVLVAPQLAVANSGPIIATFLAGPSLGGDCFQCIQDIDVNAIRETPVTGYRLFNSIIGNPTPGAQAQTPGLPAGTNITFAATFAVGVPPEPTVSLTAGRTAAQTFFFEPPGSAVQFALMFNTGVVETGRDRVLIGFTPFSTPMRFGGFPLRISVSNVCVR